MPIFAPKKSFGHYSRPVTDSHVLRVTSDWFFRMPPNCISWSQNINFEPKKNLTALVGRSTTPTRLRPPWTDFSKCHQIAYLDPKILIWTEKKIWLLESVGRRLQYASGRWRPNFQNAAKSHIWILEYSFWMGRNLTPKDCWSATPTTSGIWGSIF